MIQKISGFVLAVFFAFHFFGMQFVAFAENDHHCGAENNVSYECCEVVANSVGAYNYTPIFGEKFFLPKPFWHPKFCVPSLKTVQKISAFWHTKNFPPPEIWGWKNGVVMRC